ncbi:heparinase II/III family protein [uncultured Microbacterium sp.]|uniref:heparinase II/III domain-containing protein n=1 Tax=uncultured Microbacterium sp. TaxID=191216 RepID=UPI0035CAB001
MRERALVPMLEGAAARFGLPTIEDRSIWLRIDGRTREQITAAAGAERGTAWPSALPSAYARYVRDGNRTEYEAGVSGRQQRLTRAVVLAAITDESVWLDEVADGIVVLCEQSTWSWPAHDDAHERRGFILPDASAPYLDLGAGEVVVQLAVADHVLGTRLESRWPGLRERIRHEATIRVFEPFLNRDDLWWLGYRRTVNNWNPWIIGNVISAAVLLIDDTPTRARVMDRALESLDRFVATLPSDGAIDEGFSYWWQGACRLLECLDVVSRVTDGDLDAGDIPVVRETLRFPHRMQLGDHWYVNVADGSARSFGREPWDVPFRWGMRLGDHDVVAHARSKRIPGEPVIDVGAGLARVLRALADAEWRDATPADPPLPEHVWLGSVQLFVARQESGDSHGLALVVKGGHNGESHNHKDVGSVIVGLDGRPLIVDIGKPTYTAQTFGADRYENPAMRSSWHNTIAPFGLEQGEGSRFAARMLAEPARTGAPQTTPSIRLELASAYPLPEGDSWIRDARLDRQNHRVVVSDEWKLSGTAGQETSIHFILAGEVSIDDAVTRVRADVSARALRITVSSRENHATPFQNQHPIVDVWQLDDPELTAVWGQTLTRLTFASPHPRFGELRTTIEVDR